MTLKKIYIALIGCIALTACTEELTSPSAQEGLSFSVSIDDGTLVTRQLADREMETTALAGGLYLHTTTEPRSAVTRGTLLEGETFPTTQTFGVSGYRYTTATPIASTQPNFYYNAQVAYTGTKWVSSQQYYIPTSTEKLAFYAYYPYDATATDLSSNTTAGPLTVNYTVNTTDITAQTDLMTACATELTYHSGPDYRVPLTFRHALTAIRIELGEDVAPGYVRKVSLLNVGISGKHTVGSGWTVTSKGNLEVDFTNGNTVSGYDTNTEMGVAPLLADEKTILMIPQSFAANDEEPCLYFEINDGIQTHEFYYHLSGKTWEAGTVITYRINTQSINVVHIGSVTYPAKWGEDDFSVKTAYAEHDALGVYVVDGDEVKAANAKYVFNGTSWELQGTNNALFNSTYTYYAYYPYRDDIAGGYSVGDKVTVGADADTFFGSIISSWQISADQSTAVKLTANDLQISKGTISGTSHSTIDLQMQHKMGLAKVTMGSRALTGNVVYTPASTSTGTSYTRQQTIWVKATDQLDTPPFDMYLQDSTYCAIAKGAQNITLRSVSNVYNQWSRDVTVAMETGLCKYDTVYVADCTASYTWYGTFYTATSSVQTFDVTETGDYMLEVWGAQGGTATYNGVSVLGGAGGYSAGYASLIEGNILRVVVGGAGAGGSTAKGNYAGGYNGGGQGYDFQVTTTVWVAGGGATHIATELVSNGLLSNYSSNANQQKIVIVAGGGGGAACGTAGQCPGGYGGGLNGGQGGSTSTVQYALGGYGGTQTSAGIGYGRSQSAWVSRNGAFGAGGGGNSSSKISAAGGGGGWYGGGGGWRMGSSGGGGSGYIKSTLKRAVTIAGDGNATFPTTTASGTEAGHSGAGYARIAYLVPVKNN